MLELASPSGYERLKIDVHAPGVVSLEKSTFDGPVWSLTAARFALDRVVVVSFGDWARSQADRLWKSKGAAALVPWSGNLSGTDEWRLSISCGEADPYGRGVSQAIGEFTCTVQLSQPNVPGGLAAQLSFIASVTTLDRVAEEVLHSELVDQ